MTTTELDKVDTYIAQMSLSKGEVVGLIDDVIASITYRSVMVELKKRKKLDPVNLKDLIEERLLVTNERDRMTLGLKPVEEYRN
jgi:predicted transcriptional regulator